MPPSREGGGFLPLGKKTEGENEKTRENNSTIDYPSGASHRLPWQGEALVSAVSLPPSDEGGVSEADGGRDRVKLQSFGFFLTTPQSRLHSTAADGGRPLCRFATFPRTAGNHP